MSWAAHRYHDISCGHRVHGHESKCAHLHGHNYRVHFEVTAQLDAIGRVLDFSVIKQELCMWLENNWDHRFLIWQHDPAADSMTVIDPVGVVMVPFNPTAENMAQYLVEVIGPQVLEGYNVVLARVVIEETRKCAASYALEVE